MLFSWEFIASMKNIVAWKSWPLINHWEIYHCLQWDQDYNSFWFTDSSSSPLESPFHIVDSFISEDRVPSSVSMTGEYFWPFDICLLCKEQIKVEKDSAWSLPAGPDVWIENDVSHYFCFSCYPTALLGIWVFLILQEHLAWFY